MNPMKLGAFAFDDPIFLAPMAGVTDTSYRVIAHGMGCPLAFAEMVSSQGIHYRNEHTMNMLRTEPDERPIAMQIFAKSAAMAAEAAAYIEELGTADILDFNMGCPAPKVVRNGEGSALMRDPKRAEEILTAIRRATRLPFTVKMRLGRCLAQRSGNRTHGGGGRRGRGRRAWADARAVLQRQRGLCSDCRGEACGRDSRHRERGCPPSCRSQTCT